MKGKTNAKSTERRRNKTWPVCNIFCLSRILADRRRVVLRTNLRTQNKSAQTLQLSEAMPNGPPGWFAAGEDNQPRCVRSVNLTFLPVPLRPTWKDRAQRCEAWYYAGMQRLPAGDKKTAADYFNKCLGTQEKNFDEYNLAVLHPSRSNCRIRLAGPRRRLASRSCSGNRF